MAITMTLANINTFNKGKTEDGTVRYLDTFLDDDIPMYVTIVAVPVKGAHTLDVSICVETLERELVYITGTNITSSGRAEIDWVDGIIHIDIWHVKNAPKKLQYMNRHAMISADGKVYDN